MGPHLREVRNCTINTAAMTTIPINAPLPACCLLLPKLEKYSKTPAQLLGDFMSGVQISDPDTFPLLTLPKYP
ncbi:hypothetical protein E2C01_037544 [Portunus trituberculatus]|uniref:Uncharacterized protein n=1 Tax=Portunus trituberculatus TaxID=210409 RepID=A0A5B7FF81_PORTR|nr:hypothetical protein [Portunus trituberculatus]